MNGYMKRNDDFETRRAHLKDLSDEALKERFWALAEAIVEPLLDLAYTHTSPSVERSVLLRMGFSSLEAQPLVDKTIEHGLIGHGAGHVVYAIAKTLGIDVREAGLALIEGEHWEIARAHFSEKDLMATLETGGGRAQKSEGAYHAGNK